MIASILSKKKTAGATHALIDIPVGPSAKVRSRAKGEALAERFRDVAHAIGLAVEVVVTEASAPIGRGVGPRLEALDVRAVLAREPDAPVELREKSLYLAARLLECTGTIPDAGGYRAAQQALDSGRALAKFEEIVAAQGRREPPPAAPFRAEVGAKRDGRLHSIDCLEINTIAKLAGAPANPAAGLRVLRGVDAVVSRGEPLLEIHAQSRAQLEFARDYAEQREQLFEYGF
jgi:thymidine phosphorylase